MQDENLYPTLSRRQIFSAGAGILAAPTALTSLWRPVAPTITPVPTAVAAFIGTHPSGPVNHPVLVSGVAAFNQQFGAIPPSAASTVGTLLYAVSQFFANGGQFCYVVRVPDIKPATFLGTKATSTGMYALDQIASFNLLAFPGVADRTLWQQAEAYCVSRNAFLILDSPGEQRNPTQLTNELRTAAAVRSDHAALYYPWLVAPDFFVGNKTVNLPPSPTIAGVYASTDATRGVWKSPAGIAAKMVGVSSLTYPLTDPEGDTLNQLNINSLRTFPGSGPVVWAGRTFQSPQTLPCYVSSTRFQIFVEQSIVQGLSWTASEPNQSPLWAQVRDSINAFLMGLFQQGALQGSTPASAFFVKCDQTTMSQTDIAQGNLIALVGIAILVPSEFVIIRIVAKAGPPTLRRIIRHL